MPRFILPVQGTYTNLAGAKLYFFVGSLTGTGSSTPQNTYSDAALTVANDNPIEADANGRFSDNIFLDPGLIYRVVLQDSNGVQIFDKNPYNTASTLDTWQQSYPAIYLSTTSYRYENVDRTADLHIGQRVYMQGGADRYATIKSFSFSTHTDVVVEDVIDGTKGSTVNVSMTSASLENRHHNAVASISTISDLRAMKQPQDVRVVVVNDNKRGGIFYWNSGSTSTDDDGTIFKPTAIGVGEAGRWLRRYSGPANVEWFNVVADDTTDDTTALANSGASSVESLVIKNPVYVNGSVTMPKSKTIYFTDAGRVRAGALASAVFNGRLVSANKPVIGAESNVQISNYDYSVPADFSTIQEAVDFVPSNQWQRFNLSISDGTYNEEVFINNKRAASATTGAAVSGQRTGLYIIGNATTPTNVKVDSFLIVDSGGAVFTPLISSMEITSTNSKTDEIASLEFYGCTSGAVQNCVLSATGADKGILSYGSHISVEDTTFGTGNYKHLLYTKHSGVIAVNSNTRLSSGTSCSGTATDNIATATGGPILASDLSQMSTQKYNRFDVEGVGTGFVYSGDERAIYGPGLLADYVSAYHSYFTDLSQFIKSEVGSGTVTIDANNGIVLDTGTTASSTASAYIRRLNTISGQAINGRQQLLAAVQVNSVGAGTTVEVGIGDGVGQPRVLIRVGDTNVEAVYVDTSAVETKTTITTTANILAAKCVFDISVIKGNTSAQGVARFRIRTTAFAQYYADLTFSDSSATTFHWVCRADTPNTNSANAYIGELRLFRG